MGRLLVIGLDCATPQLVFDRWKDLLPNLTGIGERGARARLFSTIPPITVPAWTAMMTSKDPGTLGFYGFRNRKSYAYEDLYYANARYVKEKTVWNYLSRNRMKSLIFGVPQTYPPKPLNGAMVSSFLAPAKDAGYTYPPDIAAKLDEAADGDYMIDVRDFRTDDKDWLLESIYEMTEKRFKAFKRLYGEEEYDFAMMVEMGIDRIHHGFWRYFDEEHRLYEPGNKYEYAIRDYYVQLDQWIGDLLQILREDDAVMVVSDHGAKGMHGAICINEWLQEKGYLTLKEQPKEPTRLKTEMIDFEKTRVWGEGGYYARIFFNVEGREPKGQIPKEEYDSFRDAFIQELEAMPDENGNQIGTRVFKPEDVYRSVKNIPPDLIAYLGNLDWRSAGSVGTGTIHLFENDTGPDDANHAEEGILIMEFKDRPLKEIQEVQSIYDVAPTILDYFGVQVPEDMIGISMLGEEKS